MLDSDRLGESILSALEQQGVEFGETREEVSVYWRAIAAAIVDEMARAVVTTTITGTAATDGLGVDTYGYGFANGDVLEDASVSGTGQGTIS